MEPRLNLLDVVLVVAFGYVAVRGFKQGALSQVAAFGGAAAGLFAGALAAPPLAGMVVDQPGFSMALLTMSLLSFFLLAGQALGVTIGMALRRAAERVGVATLDRALGVLVGAVGLVLVVWLAGSVLAQGPIAPVARQVSQSRVVAVLDRALPAPPDVFGRVTAYIDRHGFPQVFSGLRPGITASPVQPTSDAAVQAASGAGQPSTVQVQSLGCGGVSSGSGFVAQPGIVVTNAHVVAGGDALVVRELAGERSATAIHVDPALDLAVLAVPNLQAPPLAWASEPAQRSVEGATFGFPGGRSEMVVRPATVRARIAANGRDIYGRERVEREVLVLSAEVEQGDSGGPFVAADGSVAGVVFAADAGSTGTGYALAAELVAPDVAAAAARNTSVPTGSCRF